VIRRSSESTSEAVDGRPPDAGGPLARSYGWHRGGPGGFHRHHSHRAREVPDPEMARRHLRNHAFFPQATGAAARGQAPNFGNLSRPLQTR